MEHNQQENPGQWAAFSSELERRFAELENWAMANWPDQNRPLTRADFEPARKEIGLVSAKLRHENLGAPEPSEGGPQYVNVSPTPWP